MRTTVRIALVAALIALTTLATSAQTAPEPSTTVFLVRHAEKGAEGADPSLSDAGRKRANALADMLADAGITVIFSSEFHRTQETAAPLAERLGIKVTVVPGKDIDGLVARVRELKPGARALVVGHSNTIPVLASRLTGAKAAEMSDSEFDRLYVAALRGTAPGDLVVMHYGAIAASR
jgi:broad specificity phosphatase PhoE